MLHPKTTQSNGKAVQVQHCECFHDFWVWKDRSVAKVYWSEHILHLNDFWVSDLSLGHFCCSILMVYLHFHVSRAYHWIEFWCLAFLFVLGNDFIFLVSRFKNCFSPQNIILSILFPCTNYPSAFLLRGLEQHCSGAFQKACEPLHCKTKGPKPFFASFSLSLSISNKESP